MNRPSKELFEALPAMGREPRFAAFVAWLDESRLSEIRAMITERNPVEVHVSQGRVDVLQDILDLVRTAKGQSADDTGFPTGQPRP